MRLPGFISVCAVIWKAMASREESDSAVRARSTPGDVGPKGQAGIRVGLPGMLEKPKR
jgi:hypothetical protein